MTATILDQIVAHKRQHTIPHLPAVDRCALNALPPTRGFAQALQGRPGEAIRVIAECKKGSPSKGIFTEAYDPVQQALFYRLGGASCISVLTDEHFFYGHLSHLTAVREAIDIPIIRKDFILDERQIAEARLHGADAILLIAACLEQGQLRDLQGFAQEIGLDTLVEIHNADEATQALAVDARMIGVNNRNLADFSLDLERTFSLLPALLDQQRIIISESGIYDRQQCLRLEEAGVDAILVGETLMRADDPSAAIHSLRGRTLNSSLL